MNQYGLPVVSGLPLYRQLARKNTDLRLVPLRGFPALKEELRYAGTDNFLGKKLYETKAAAYLLRPAAIALKKVLADLEASGLGLIVWDAYRPYSVTKQIWEEVQDERYAASPVKGSGHNRGLSIDCTLYDLTTGTALEMPTAFDDFSEKAHHDHTDLPPAALRNRQLLRNVMEKHGFRALSTEWWHYSFPDPHAPVLNLSFEDLEHL